MMDDQPLDNQNVDFNFLTPEEERKWILLQRVNRAQNGVAIVSFICLILAFGIWAVIWYRNRERPSYRYVMLMFLFGTCLASLFMDELRLFSPDVYAYDQMAEQTILFSLTGYGILCMVRAVNQNVSSGQAGLCILSIILLAVLLNGLEWAINVMDLSSGDINLTALETVLVEVPKMISLAAGLIINCVVLYWLFALDNTKYRSHRDYRIIRHSSVCLLLLMVYCAAIEIHWMVQKYHFELIDQVGIEISDTGKVVQNLMICFLLCFLDLEVLNLCPCVQLDSSDVEEQSPLANTGNDSATEMTFGTTGQTTHVSSFETEITPRHPPAVLPKPDYGALPDRP